MFLQNNQTAVLMDSAQFPTFIKHKNNLYNYPIIA